MGRWIEVSCNRAGYLEGVQSAVGVEG